LIFERPSSIGLKSGARRSVSAVSVQRQCGPDRTYHQRVGGATEESAAAVNGRWAAPTDVARLAAEADRVLTF
jgi:hypothetical protein